MNKVIICGTLTKDVELKNGSVATFTVAVNRGKDKEGNDKGADFIPVTVFGKNAENCAKYTAKGKKILVEGSYHTGFYENKEGKRIYTTEVYGDKVEFIEWASSNGKTVEVDLNNGFEAIEKQIPF